MRLPSAPYARKGRLPLHRALVAAHNDTVKDLAQRTASEVRCCDSALAIPRQAFARAPFPRTTDLPLRPPTNRALPPSPGNVPLVVVAARETSKWCPLLTSIRRFSKPLNEPSPKVHVADKSVNCQHHAPTCLPADLCGSTLDGELLLPISTQTRSTPAWRWEEQASTQPHAKWLFR